MYDSRTVAAIGPGLVAYEESRFWDAIHVLVPQVERVIRNIGLALGVGVLSYRSSSGQLLWVTLKELLEEPRVVSTLDQIAGDFALHLKYVLIDPRGWNIRNDVAHGLLNPDHSPSAEALVVILILLAISVLRADPVPGTSLPDDTNPATIAGW